MYAYVQDGYYSQLEREMKRQRQPKMMSVPIGNTPLSIDDGKTTRFTYKTYKVKQSKRMTYQDTLPAPTNIPSVDWNKIAVVRPTTAEQMLSRAMMDERRQKQRADEGLRLMVRSEPATTLEFLKREKAISDIAKRVKAIYSQPWTSEEKDTALSELRRSAPAIAPHLDPGSITVVMEEAHARGSGGMSSSRLARDLAEAMASSPSTVTTLSPDVMASMMRTPPRESAGRFAMPLDTPEAVPVGSGSVPGNNPVIMRRITPPSGRSPLSPEAQQIRRQVAKRPRMSSPLPAQMEVGMESPEEMMAVMGSPVAGRTRSKLPARVSGGAFRG